MIGRLAICFVIVLAGSAPMALADKNQPPSFASLIAADAPAFHWRFSASDKSAILPLGGELDGRLVGNVKLGTEGPRPPGYPAFEQKNRAARFSGGSLRFTDPGAKSPLDFGLGDALTLEAWVRTDPLRKDGNVYIIGKGRTNNEGVPAENQNYALRLRGGGGAACLSFLFRNHQNRGSQDYHRWTSTLGVTDDQWHHVAVTYTFGTANSLRGYLDGAPVEGVWDMGGATDLAPVVDDDELWIGSSLGGNPSSSFHGEIDEIVIHRRALSGKQMAARYLARKVPAYDLAAELARAPDRGALVEVFEQGWPSVRKQAEATFLEPVTGVSSLPKKYSDKGLVVDRSNPFSVRISAKHETAGGEYEFLLRCKSAARFYVDGELIGHTPVMSRNASGHEEVPVIKGLDRDGLRSLLPAHQEKLFAVRLEPGVHHFRVDALVGGDNLRAELGELALAVAAPNKAFYLLGADANEAPYNDDFWLDHADGALAQTRQRNAERRAEASQAEAKYWDERRQIARRTIDSRPPLEAPECPPEMPFQNVIDAYLGVRLAAANIQPAPLLDDYGFQRRLTLDITGRPPTRTEIDAFLSDRRLDRRHRLIDRLLNDPGWADNWVGYWQDVLAENPGILKPKLNNTGPFRWWIHESFADNKPMDRFVSELIGMGGSAYGGGPAGFSMATQNDVPMAAKAHVIATAFLGAELKCARCHDAPYHPFQQKELFQLAAMLEKKPIKLPGTSTVPQDEAKRRPLITISLKPGAMIAARWPFQEFGNASLPAGVLRNPEDSREQLAAIITSPENDRFAQVIVNRLWARYLGWGIVEPVDDWHEQAPSHPELLDYLAREFVRGGYDVKQIAKMIFQSHAYQRRALPSGAEAPPAGTRLFAAPRRRRLSAEQVVDSLFAVAGKRIGAEPLTLDPEGRRTEATFLNLGVPRRAWEFTSLSNERDRPALALPRAQSVVDVLLAFGWRDARPNPTSNRDQTPTILQPLTIANGIVGNRAARLSDDSVFTLLALDAETAEQFVEQSFLQVLGRPPTTEEREPLAETLRRGFAERKTGEPRKPYRPALVHAVSWSNHLNAEATRIKLELERKIREGDPPTETLQNDWRMRAEDVVWALLNSPEFVFSP